MLATVSNWTGSLPKWSPSGVSTASRRLGRRRSTRFSSPTGWGGYVSLADFQSVIMIAVGWTGIYYELTPNKVALGIVAVGAAWLATKLAQRFVSVGRSSAKAVAVSVSERA